METGLSSGSIPPGETGADCFQRHLREAISLNERRRPTYARWSDGASRGVSDRLIEQERLALDVAWLVDRRARRFQEAGIPIGCVEFVSMSLTPPLGDDPSRPPARAQDRAPSADSVRRVLVDAYGVGGFAVVARSADALLERLEEAPAYDCMLRHLVESIWRVAWLAPQHAGAARAAGLPSTVGLSELYLRLNLAALEDAAVLDRAARPLQEAGIPILCRDVPPIRRMP